MFRGQVGHRHLQHRNVGFGVHDQERYESPVVEATFALGNGLARGHHRRHARRQFRGPGRVVAELVVAFREAVEVVCERRRPDCAECQRRRLPVSADDEDRFGAWHRGAPGRKFARPDGVVDEHRRAVAEIDRGQPVCFRAAGRGSAGRRAFVRHFRSPRLRPARSVRRPKPRRWVCRLRCAFGCAASSAGAAACVGRPHRVR